MKARLLLIVMGTVVLAGCATTQQKAAPINQVQNQVVDLQQRMEEQEKEIVDLKYEVKDLSAKKTTSAEQPVVEESSPTAPVKSSKSVASVESDSILHVAVSASELQKALKGAGVYEGKVDGKLGPRTKSAVIDFQKQHNLKADGVVGQKTWNELKTYVNE